MKTLKDIFIIIFIIPVCLFSQKTTVSFQEGVSGYNSTIDTYVDINNPDSSFSSSTGLLWDGAPSEITTLIRFDNIFVSQGGSIPDNSYIVSATLTYYVYDGGDDAAVSEVSSTWNNNLTWNQFDFVNDIGTFVGYAESGTVNTYESFDVTASLANWSVNPSLNYGWIFQFTGNGGSDVYSSERTPVNQRPELIVTYSINFPPSLPTIVYPADKSTEVPYSPSLIVNVTDPENDKLEVRYFFRFKGSNFTIIGMPDTQHYTDNGNFYQNFYDQTNWIVANKDALNIVFISQLGDCVQSGDTADSEWQIADSAWTIVENPITTGLEDGMPYGLNVGNTDQSPPGGGDSASTVKYNEYFGVARFQDRSYYGGHYGSENNNHFELFSSSGMDFIIINLEYDIVPDQDVLDWADSLLTTYSSRRAIAASHYLIDGDDDPSPNALGVQGQQIYDNFKDNSNLFLMLCGHIPGEGRRTDDFNGSTINTLLSNYQNYTNGGNGYLRIMEFRPSENKIYVSTYSPSLNQYENDSNSEFILDYDMGAQPFLDISNLIDVNSGSNASFDLSLLLPDSEYEWYVEVSDGYNTITSPIWSFTTEAEDISLPVFLSSFTANLTEKGIDLEWIVESEIENLGYIIEKSSSRENGKFDKIASYENMDELKGRGNASDRKIYRFLDRETQMNQTYFYRLADVSINGEIVYHDVISVYSDGAYLDFKLHQNYPNPFNPSTTIKYQLPKSSNVEITIFNLLGQQVWKKQIKHQAAGQHEFNVDLSNNSSGIYFYSLESGNYLQTKKMILLK